MKKIWGELKNITRWQYYPEQSWQSKVDGYLYGPGIVLLNVLAFIAASYFFQ